MIKQLNLLLFILIFFISPIVKAIGLQRDVIESREGTMVRIPPSFEERIASLQSEETSLKFQWSHVEQKIGALQQFINSQKTLNLKWIDAKEGASISSPFMVEVEGKKQSICHAEFQRGTHPGILTKGGCEITYGGDALVIPFYQVLSGKVQTQWKKVDENKVVQYQLVEQNKDKSLWKGKLVPIQGGYSDTPNFANNTPLFICKATYEGQVYIGKVVSSFCNIPVGPKEVTVSDFQVLFGQVN